MMLFDNFIGFQLWNQVVGDVHDRRPVGSHFGTVMPVDFSLKN